MWKSVLPFSSILEEQLLNVGGDGVSSMTFATLLIEDGCKISSDEMLEVLLLFAGEDGGGVEMFPDF